MASPEKRAARKQLATGAATAAPKSEKTERDLNDAATQGEILSPKVLPTTIGGREYILHPFSAKRSRLFTGLVQQIVVETFSGKTEATKTLPLLSRMAGIVAEKYNDEFLPFLAVATGEPGEIASAKERELAAEFDEVITYSEVARAFVAICDLNRSIQNMTGADNPNV